ncbi:hypothetical protein [Planctobacterium marinum]|uniref:Uncharacterized protein n=1 Tax=Planctobacterium marinum TaxID=1631968 RepID=A0AA48HNN4_9ALTE|nr:hypothetical protein MACH26_36470 [Planctobacterium marinum]
MAQAEASTKGVLINFIIIVIMFVLIATFVWYFDKNEPNVQKTALMNAADKFNNLVIAAHWQWRAKGEPERIMLVDYNIDTQKETNRLPVKMSDLGWPRVEPNMDGCKKVWDMILDMPLQLDTFRVRAEFFDGINNGGKILDSKCRFSITAGAWFDYYIYTGRVQKFE